MTHDDANSMEVTISFLHPHGPSPFCVCQQTHIPSIHLSEVLMKADPGTNTGVWMLRGTSTSMAIHACIEIKLENLLFNTR